MLFKILIVGNRLAGTLKLYPSSLRKLLQPLHHLWGPYSTTVLPRDSGPLSGKWTLVFKKGDKQAKENYRPITVLPLFGKVFEHLLCTQITTYYDRILYSRMTAYRKQHRCESTLIGLVEDWRKALDSKKVYLLAMDMSKAFDSLHHSLTLAKLNACGFRDSSLD